MGLATSTPSTDTPVSPQPSTSAASASTTSGSQGGGSTSSMETPRSTSPPPDGEHSAVLQEKSFSIDTGKQGDYKKPFVSAPVNVSELMDTAESRPTGVAKELKSELISSLSEPIKVHSVKFQSVDNDEPAVKKRRVSDSVTGPSSASGKEESGRSVEDMIGHGAGDLEDEDYLPPNHKFKLV